MVLDFFHFANLARKGMIRFGNGRIKVTSLRVLFVDIDTLKELEARIRALFGEQKGAYSVYQVAKGAGGRATRAHYQFSKKEGIELAQYMAKMASGAGWGRITIKDVFEDGGEVIVHDSPFKRAEANGPGCDYLRGFLAGAASYIYRKQIECIEDKCVSKGDAECHFILGKPRDLLKNARLRPFRNQILEAPGGRKKVKKKRK